MSITLEALSETSVGLSITLNELSIVYNAVSVTAAGRVKMCQSHAISPARWILYACSVAMPSKNVIDNARRKPAKALLSLR